MKKLFLIFVLTFSLHSNADCTYSLPVIGINYQGYQIMFDSYIMDKAAQKGYQLEAQAPAINIDFSTNQQGHFEYVDVEIQYQSIKAAVHKRCYTQSCAVSDARNALRSALDQFIKKLPNCSF